MICLLILVRVGLEIFVFGLNVMLLWVLFYVVCVLGDIYYLV